MRVARIVSSTVMASRALSSAALSVTGMPAGPFAVGVTTLQLFLRVMLAREAKRHEYRLRRDASLVLGDLRKAQDSMAAMDAKTSRLSSSESPLALETHQRVSSAACHHRGAAAAATVAAHAQPWAIVRSDCTAPPQPISTCEGTVCKLRDLCSFPQEERTSAEVARRHRSGETTAA